jgi:AcrR family transcriptional regulator
MAGESPAVLEAASPAVRGGTRNPESHPRRPFDYQAIAAAFAAEGFHRASMDSIAQRAGVAKPTLYRYFGSKEELLRTAIDAECDRMVEHLFAAYESARELPLAEQIKANTDACFAYVRDNPHTFELLFQSNLAGSASVSAPMESTFDRVVERMGRIFREQLAAHGSPHGQVADILAAAVVGAAYFVARDLSRRREWDQHAVLDLIAELWTRALSGVSRGTLARADRPAR